MGYEIILTDVDNTLLDFDLGSAAGVENVMNYYGIEYTQECLQTFLTLNDALWKRYEKGEIPKSYIFETRFGELLARYGVEADSLFANDLYVEGLKSKIFYRPHCMEFLNAVRGKYKLYALTNGVTLTQQVRLEKSGLSAYFDGVFISEQMGCKKPEKEFFDKVFAAIGDVDKSKCIVLGDSLTSDMQGGRNAGIDTCLVGDAYGDPRCDYVIGDLMELLPILEG
ncbi:MAG: YjjG family noncanonical pyrimidine nucleotidase [Oscillospiraceae bacterium]|nr:YjjG family noncanonical pyrimidine nucleotidase [Oscillospiraceae bacterium]